MTKNEHKTFDKLLMLILQQGATSKDILDELNLLTKMKQAYAKQEDEQ